MQKLGTIISPYKVREKPIKSVSQRGTSAAFKFVGRSVFFIADFRYVDTQKNVDYVSIT